MGNMSSPVTTRRKFAIVRICVLIIAVGAIGCNVRPSHRPFPPILDWNSVRISLKRTACRGTCPAYSVEIRGDGTVEYAGENFVAVRGIHRARIPHSAVRELTEAFRTVDFFDRARTYRGGVSDYPTYTVTLTFDGSQASLVDYAGELLGMPREITGLEELIDHVAGSERWVYGSEDTVPSLRAENFDFKSTDTEHSSMLARVAEGGSTRAVEDLIHAGMPVDGHGDRTSPNPLMGRTALVHAAKCGNLPMTKALLAAGAGMASNSEKDEALQFAAESGVADLVRLLLDSGADPKSTDGEGVTVLMRAARSGSPSVVREVLKRHPDAGARDHKGRTVLMYLEKAGPRDDADGVDRAEVARTLLQAGATTDVTDDDGRTPLMAVPFNLGAAGVLLQAGADPNLRDKDGWTALENAPTPRMTRLLLEYGADPFALTHDGISVLDEARHSSTEKARLIEDARLGRMIRRHPQ